MNKQQQARNTIRLDLSPNCLQMLTAVTRRQKNGKDKIISGACLIEKVIPLGTSVPYFNVNNWIIILNYLLNNRLIYSSHSGKNDQNNKNYIRLIFLF